MWGDGISSESGKVPMVSGHKTEVIRASNFENSKVPTWGSIMCRMLSAAHPGHEAAVECAQDLLE